MTEKLERPTDKFGVDVIIEHVDTFGKGLTPWEVKFIAGLIDNPPLSRISERQLIVLNRIYDEKC